MEETLLQGNHTPSREFPLSIGWFPKKTSVFKSFKMLSNMYFCQHCKERKGKPFCIKVMSADFDGVFWEVKNLTLAVVLGSALT